MAENREAYTPQEEWESSENKWASAFGFPPLGWKSKPTAYETQPTGTAEQQAMGSSLFQLLMGMQPATEYGGQFVQPTTEQEKTGMEALTEYLGRETPGYFGDIESALTQALSGESPYEVDPTATSRYFEDYVKPQAMHTYTEDLLPQLRESFAGGGKFWATPRLGAETGLAGDVSRGLTSARGGLALEDIRAERAGKTTGAQIAAGTLPQATSISSLLEEGGLRKAQAAQEYGYFPREEKNLEREYMDWLRVQEDPYRRAGLMTQALGIPTTETRQYPETPGWIEKLLA